MQTQKLVEMQQQKPAQNSINISLTFNDLQQTAHTAASLTAIAKNALFVKEDSLDTETRIDIFNTLLIAEKILLAINWDEFFPKD